MKKRIAFLITFLFLLTLITPFKLIDAKEDQRIKIDGNFIKDNLEVIRNTVPDGIPDIMNLQEYKIEDKIDGEYVNTNTGFKVKLNFYSLIGNTRDEKGISHLDWECLSTGYQVYYVFVKAADGGYLYWYNNQEKSDTILHGLEHKDGNNKCHDISHVNFYYGQIGSCKVIKTKDDDGDGKSDGPHEGVEFTLKNLETGVSYKKATDKDGIALFENMPVGQNYTLVEKIPDGYTTNLTDNKFMIECGIQNEIKVMNTKIVEQINYPDITISKNDNDFTAKPGDEIEYEIVVENIGKASANDVKVYESLPQYTTFAEGKNDGWKLEGGKYVYEIGTMGIDDKKVIKFVVKADENIPEYIDRVINIVEVKTTSTESNTSNNTASDFTPIIHPAEQEKPILDITKSDKDAEAKPGDEVVYWITIKNNGKVMAKEVKVFEKLPAYTLFVDGKNPGWTVSGEGYYYDIGTLDAGEVKTISFKVKVDEKIPGTIKKIENTAVLSARDIDDISASDDTPITPPPPDLPSTGRENSFNPFMGILSVIFMALGILIKKIK